MFTNTIFDRSVIPKIKYGVSKIVIRGKDKVNKLDQTNVVIVHKWDSLKDLEVLVLDNIPHSTKCSWNVTGTFSQNQKNITT